MPDAAATVRSIRENIARVERGERKNVRALLRMIEELRTSLLARLEGGGTEYSQALRRQMLVETERTVEELRKAVSSALARQFAEAMRAGAAETLRQIVVALPETERVIPAMVSLPVEFLDFVEGHRSNLVREVTERARAEITRAVNLGAVGTLTRDEVRARLGAILTKEGRSPGAFGSIATQVERIHRTETSGLLVLSQRATAGRAAEQVGRVTKKKWISATDTRTRIAHRDLNGVTVPMGEHFNVGAGSRWSKVSYEQAEREGGVLGSKADTPHDPRLPVEQRANCRCTFGLVFGKFKRQTPQEILGVPALA